MKKSMVALKPFRYRTRHLRAGDYFMAAPMEARVLEAVKRAAYAPAPARQAAEPPAPVAAAKDPLEEIRAEYQALSGHAADRRWGEARIRAEIDALNGDAGEANPGGGLF